MNRSLVSLTGFDQNGQEVANTLLGGDYRYVSADFAYDDQRVQIDKTHSRLLIPYSVSHPLNDPEAPYSEHRLTLAEYDDAGIEHHGFVLAAAAERSLNVSKSQAFAFNPEFIESLTRIGSWQQETVFDGELPDVIYYSRGLPLHVQQFQRADRFLLKLIDDNEDTTADVIDTLSVVKQGAGYCLSPQLYFDRDRVLIVQETAGVYSHSQDCPDDRSETQVTLKGYSYDDQQGFFALEDQTQLQDLYRQIQQDLHCLTDINNANGQEIDQLPDGETLTCWTADDYQHMR